MAYLEAEANELRELVDGQEKWSHRKRLHKLENDKHAAELVAEALSQFALVRNAKTTRVREWGAFALAVAALVIGFLH